MSDRDEHLEALRGMWSELKALNGRIDGTNARLDETVSRLDGMNTRLDQTVSRLDETNDRLDRLEHRQTESEMRITTELVAVAGAVREVRDVLRDHRADRARIDRLEQRVDVLEKRRG